MRCDEPTSYLLWIEGESSGPERDSDGEYQEERKVTERVKMGVNSEWNGDWGGGGHRTNFTSVAPKVIQHAAFKLFVCI